MCARLLHPPALAICISGHHTDNKALKPTTILPHRSRLCTLALGFGLFIIQAKYLTYVTLKRNPYAFTSSPSVARSFSRVSAHVQPPWVLVNLPPHGNRPCSSSSHTCPQCVLGSGTSRDGHTTYANKLCNDGLTVVSNQW